MTYTAAQLGIKPPSGGFENLGWYAGRQYKNGTLGEVGVIHPESSQTGAGQPVNPTVNAASAALQGKTPEEFNAYLTGQAKQTIQPAAAAPSGASATTPAGSTDTSGAGVGAGALSQTPTINLTNIYDTALQSGEYTAAQTAVSDLQSKINDRREELTQASSYINENPFLSEGSRTGRIKRLTDFAEQDINNYVNELSIASGKVAMIQADAKLKVDLATGQYNIDRQAKQDQLSLFNSLLASGALNNANGSDIATLSLSTGIPTSMLQSAIQVSKDSAVKTSVTTVDDGSTISAVVINTQTGEIIKKTVIGNSKPSTSGTVPGSSAFKATQSSALNSFITGKANQYGNISPADWNAALNSYLAADLGTRNDFILTYATYADPNRGDFESASGYNFPKSIRSDVVSGAKTVKPLTDIEKLSQQLGVNP